MLCVCAFVYVCTQVTVVTADKRGAGTDGSVELSLTGQKGSTPLVSLYNDYWYNFERGRTDTFEVTASDVGAIQSANLTLVRACMDTHTHTRTRHDTAYDAGLSQGAVMTLPDAKAHMHAWWII